MASLEYVSALLYYSCQLLVLVGFERVSPLGHYENYHPERPHISLLAGILLRTQQLRSHEVGSTANYVHFS